MQIEISELNVAVFNYFGFMLYKLYSQDIFTSLDITPDSLTTQVPFRDTHTAKNGVSSKKGDKQLQNKSKIPRYWVSLTN